MGAFINVLLSFFPRAVGQSIPLLYGCTGEIITEKSGNLNLGIPGVMYVGAISGVIGSFLYEQNAGDSWTSAYFSPSSKTVTSKSIA